MKKLHKIIALFVFIFITGILVTVITVNTSLNTHDSQKEIVKNKKETLYLLKAEKKRV